MKLDIEKIPCTSCGESMPRLRRDLYGYTFCIKCSTVLPKVARVVTYGEGDHTWNEVEILDQDTAKRVLELENLIDSKNLLTSDLLDYNQDESLKYRSIGAVREIIKTSEDIDTDDIEEEEISEEEDDIFTGED
jgi:hypothetical protein